MTKILYTIFLLLAPLVAFSQHTHEHMEMEHNRKDTTAAPVKPVTRDIHSMDNMDSMQDKHMHQHIMSHSLSLNLPMTRNGSGTSWNPDATPVYAWMKHTNSWMFMFMGDIFVRYNKQDLGNTGNRGGEKWDAPDMLMAMGQCKVGKNGLIHFNAMLSTDALIAGGEGYPLLFQSGESWDGKPLVDRQHPHDLFSELSVSYAYSFNSKSDAYVYVGYPGEPALGPTTFMHRPLGGFIPDAPIGHHWADATHISFGVATLGYRYGMVKLEGSSFTGREPNENRYNFDKPSFDSWSGRLSFNPGANWALQVSTAFLKSPEELRPSEDIQRTTASATYAARISDDRLFSATALWGQNHIADEEGSNAGLLEAVLKLRKTALYFRAEGVQKSGEELAITIQGVNEHALYTNYSLTLGGAYDVIRALGATVAAGAQFSANFPDRNLQPLYGTIPLSGEVYLHIYPHLIK